MSNSLSATGVSHEHLSREDDRGSRGRCGVLQRRENGAALVADSPPATPRPGPLPARQTGRDGPSVYREGTRPRVERVQLPWLPRLTGKLRPLARKDERPLTVRLPVRAVRLDVQRLPAETL